MSANWFNIFAILRQRGQCCGAGQILIGSGQKVWNKLNPKIVNVVDGKTSIKPQNYDNNISLKFFVLLPENTGTEWY